MEPKQELTVLDICNIFGVSRTTVYKWQKKGLKSYKLPGNGQCDPRRFAREDVMQFADKIGRTPINDSFSQEISV